MADQIKILMVDDRPENLLALAAVLESPQYCLISARSGEEALKWLLREDFAVILLDVQMPVLSGLETARLIRTREKTQHTPIIFITANSPDVDEVNEGYALGAIDFIFKPIDPDTLRYKINGFVNLYRYQEQLGILVRDRTRELTEVNLKLCKEIEQRKVLEAELKEHRIHLENLVEERTRELKLANELLLAANTELEAFCYSVSHDLRAPLRSIDGFSLALLEDYQTALDDVGRDYLRRVRAATLRMGQLIDDLLNLSRVTSRELQFQRVDLSQIADEKIRCLMESEPQRQVTIKLAPELVVEGDRRLLTLAMDNLLDNAWKFASHKSETIIEVGVLVENQERVYFIRDNGAGFNMNYASKLFTPFQRLHTDKQFPGTGIGLATVKRIISRHAGKIWAESIPGEGTTFYFTLAGSKEKVL